MFHLDNKMIQPLLAIVPNLHTLITHIDRGLEEPIYAMPQFMIPLIKLYDFEYIGTLALHIQNICSVFYRKIKIYIIKEKYQFIRSGFK